MRDRLDQDSQSTRGALPSPETCKSRRQQSGRQGWECGREAVSGCTGDHWAGGGSTVGQSPRILGPEQRKYGHLLPTWSCVDMEKGAEWAGRWLGSHLHWVWPLQGSSQQAGGHPQGPRLPRSDSDHSGGSSSGGWGRVWQGTGEKGPPSPPFQQQGDGGGRSSQQSDSVVVPGLGHVHPIDLQERGQLGGPMGQAGRGGGSGQDLLPPLTERTRSPTCRVPARWAAPPSAMREMKMP